MTMNWQDLASSNLPTLSTATPPGRSTAFASTNGTSTSAPSAATTTANDPQYSSLNLNLSMLQAAGQSLLSSSTSSRVGTAAVPLFADAMVSSVTHATSTSTTAAAQHQHRAGAAGGQHRPLEPLDETLHRFQQDILRDLVQQLQDSARASTEHAVEAQLQKAWDVERAAWLERHRSPGSTTTSTTNASSSSARILQHPSSSSVSPYSIAALSLSQQPWSGGTGTAAAGAGALMPRGPGTGSSTGALGGGGGGSGGPPYYYHSFVESHCQIVQNSMTNKDFSTTQTTMKDSIAKFLQICEQQNSQHRDPALAGYAAAWRWLAHLSVDHPCSAVVVEGDDSTVVVSHAVATLAHLGDQYRRHILETVRRSSQSPADGTSSLYRNDWTAHCHQYAVLCLGQTQTNRSSNRVWPVLYFCLRSGDAVAAWEAVQQHQSTIHIDAAVIRLLSVLARVQGVATSLWESSSSQNNDIVATLLRTMGESDRQTAADLLENARRMERPNLHEMGVYWFLASLPSSSSTEQPPQPVRSDTVEGFVRMEDYLMAALWNAVLQQSSPVEEALQRIVHQIVHQWGPAALDDPTSGGWSYATPLLACQQYAKALQWLATHSNSNKKLGLLQATHLGLVLSSMGIPVTDLGEKTITNHGSNNNEAASDNAIVTSLLVAYATELLSLSGRGMDHKSTATAAVVYLLHIPHATRARQEVAQLLARTADVATLAGRLTPEGTRQGGVLAELLPASRSHEVDAILVEAADLLLSHGSSITGIHGSNRQNTETACLCLMLAGRYADVLALLNERLSPVSIDADDPPDRQIWCSHSQDFQANYLQKRTHVLDTLERQNQQSLIRTNRLLLDLNRLMQSMRVRSKNEQAPSPTPASLWSMVEDLGLLPLNASDRAVKEMEYSRLDPLLQQALGPLLLCAVQILHQEHSLLQRQAWHAASGGGGGGGVVQARLQELRQRAQLYASLGASWGNLNHWQLQELTRLASVMI